MEDVPSEHPPRPSPTAAAAAVPSGGSAPLLAAGAANTSPPPAFFPLRGVGAMLCNFIHAALWEFTRERYLSPPLLCISWSQIRLLLQEAAFISMLRRSTISPAVSAEIQRVSPSSLSPPPSSCLSVSPACRLSS